MTGAAMQTDGRRYIIYLYVRHGSCAALLNNAGTKNVCHPWTDHRLLLGPAAGRLRALVEKVTAIEAKHGPFVAAFLVGDVFEKGDSLDDDETALLDGSLKRTYSDPR